MGTIEVKNTDIGRVVRLSGELVIDQATELRDSFLQAFAGVPELKLDVSGVASADLACLQVLCAAHRLGVLKGTRISLSAPPSPGLLQSMRDMALYPSTCNAPYDQGCLWARDSSHE
jgi:anti-anti-sigma regulatory factor